MMRATLLLATFKLLVVLVVVAYLIIDNRPMSCTMNVNMYEESYQECTPTCPWDDHSAHSATCSDEDGVTTCTRANSEWHFSYTGSYPDEYYFCEATVQPSCFNWTYILLLGLYVIQWASQLVTHSCFDNFDPQLDMVLIASKFDVTSSTLSTLLHPVLCLLSVAELGALAVMAAFINDTTVMCVFTYYPTGTAQIFLISFVISMEVLYPNFVLSLDEYINDGEVNWYTLVRLDLLLACNFLRFMHVFTWPAGILSWFSIRKRDQKRKKAPAVDLLSMEVRDDFAMHTLGGGSDDEKWSAMRVVRKLCSRYTVQYSFLKLVAAIIISLALNQNYEFCAIPDNNMSAADCPAGCTAHCIIPREPAFTDDNNVQYGVTCSPDYMNEAQVDNSCFCENWMLTDFLAILFNTLHFVLQCYYLIRYNNFDPQQNQIDCVQSYTFVGENITLFLTHPAISFLSVLESGVLAVSWVAVVMNLGLTCNPSVDASAAGENAGSTLLFALFMTLIEVYKANMTVATNAMRERRYGWAAFSLLRVDLFVFYGSTLFLQTFLFPFSIVGYLTTVVGAQYSGSAQGDVDRLPSKRGSNSGLSGVSVDTGRMTESLLDADSKSVDDI